MAVKRAIFLKGFDFGTSVEDVRAHCATIGKVLSVELKGKGDAVVVYGSEAIAKKAVDALDRSVIAGNTRYVDVKLKAAPGSAEVGSGKVALGGLVGNKSGVGKGGANKGAAKLALPSFKPKIAKPSKAVLPFKPSRMVMPSAGMGTTVQNGAGLPTVVSVRGFDFGTSEQDVRNHFSRMGKVVSVELKGNKGGEARVAYLSSASAKKAVEHLDQTVISGNTRYIDVKLKGGGNQEVAMVKAIAPLKKVYAIAQKPKMAKPSMMPRMLPVTPTQVKVHGFDFETDEQSVQKHCSKVGKVLSVELKGTRGGSAVVTYASRLAAEKAVRQLNETVIEGTTRYIEVTIKGGGAAVQASSKKLGVATSQASKKRKGAPASGASSACKVFVRGFDKGTPVESIVSHCSSAGSIVESKRSKKSGIILTYSSADEAQLAVDTLDKSTIEGNERYIDVKIDVGDGAPSKKAKVGEKKEKGPSGPDLERQILTGEVVSGTVVRFKGNSGFIKPHDQIDHPDSGKRKGDVYVHSQDVAGGETLEKDMEVQFVVYVDATGLGAADVSPIT